MSLDGCTHIRHPSTVPASRRGHHVITATQSKRPEDLWTFLETVRAFNTAPRPEVSFNPNIRDGLATSGLAIDKTKPVSNLLRFHRTLAAIERGG